MAYISATFTLDGQAEVIYRSKNGRTPKSYGALDWLAQLDTRIPNKGEQTYFENTHIPSNDTNPTHDYIYSLLPPP